MPLNPTQWTSWEKATMVGHVHYLYELDVHGRFMNTVFYYCTGNEPITFNGNTYYPKPIIHTEIEDTIEDSTTSVKMAASKAWINILIDNTPTKMYLKIYRWKRDILDGSLIYNGEHRNTQLQMNQFLLEFGGAFAAASTNLILYYTQKFCNHNQYGHFCGLDFDSLKYVIPPGGWIINSRKSISVPDANFDPTYWQEMILIYEIRFTEDGRDFVFWNDNIARSVTTSSFTTKYPINCDTRPSECSLTLAPSCGLNLERCKTLFGNLTHACGWPDMPKQNFAAIDITQQGKGSGGPLGPP